MVEPDLKRVIRTFTEAGAKFVLIGGFAVIAHEVLRTTDDCDLLIPDGDSKNDAAVISALESMGCDAADGLGLTLERLTGREHLRVESPSVGIVDIMRGGLPPLDFDSVLKASIPGTLDGVEFRIAGLASLVAFKRLAGRAQDIADLEKLEEIHGPLPEA